MSPRSLLSSSLGRLAPTLRHLGISHSRSATAAASLSHTGLSRCSRSATFPALNLSPGALRAMSTALPRLPILEAISKHDPASTAVVHCVSGREFRYGELLGDVGRVRDRLRDAAGGRELASERVAFLVENSYDYVVTLLAIMASKSIAVPLSPAFPTPELQYIVNQSQASLLVSSSKFGSIATKVLASDLDVKPNHLELRKHEGNKEAVSVEVVAWEDVDLGDAGMMLYTSGTTNRPKGVLLPAATLTAQCRSLVEAWEYTPKDHLLHVLPLHHIHGTVNALLTPLMAGSTIEFLFPFNADAVWTRLAAPFLPVTGETNGLTNGHANGHTNGTTNSVLRAPNSAVPKITFFTVVPTVYSRLLASHKSLPAAIQTASREAISPQNMRVSISGSAALPTPIKAAWQELSYGNVLLERYGMTEVGMALSCGLDFADRVDASVGWPLPSVQARLVDTDTGAVIQVGEEVDPETGRERQGEIQLRGPTIFKEYFRNPTATEKEFVQDPDGQGPWFKTGDVATRRAVPAAAQGQPWTKGPLYFIQGRKSADIIKTGGEKVSALEVERELLSLPEVAEAAVVAVPSGKWGHKVGAVLILDKDVVASWTPMAMRRALKSRLANYKIPQVMRVVDHIPRNAMGKINKKELVKAIFAEDHSGDEI